MVEQIIRENHCVPATIAIIEGKIHVGEQLELYLHIFGRFYFVSIVANSIKVVVISSKSLILTKSEKILHFKNCMLDQM